MADPKPTVFAAQRLPLEALSPGAFQAFVYGALQAIGPRHGFRVSQLTGTSGDGGFDSDGRRERDGALVCVQAKRYATLSMPDIVLELAKVALGASLSGATPKEHYLIASGKVRNVLHEALRELDRRTLVETAKKVGVEHADLTKLRADVEPTGESVADVIGAYVGQLDALVVWSGEAFDVQISAVWSSLKDLVGRYFTIERVLVEHPRPDFDEARYLRAVASPSADDRPLRTYTTEVPSNVRRTTASNPSAASAPAVVSSDHDDAVTACVQCSPGAIRLVTGAGGAGKTTTLRRALRTSAAMRQNAEGYDAVLPILVSLGAYRGSLRQLVEQELGVRGGHWESLPGMKLLLCDGLNELDETAAAGVVAELTASLKQGQTAAVVSMRTTGLAAPILFPPIEAVYELLPFTFGDIRRLAHERLKDAGDVATFVASVRKLMTGDRGSLMSLPFGVTTLIEAFRAKRTLPTRIGELVQDIVRRRFDANEEALVRGGASYRLPYSTLLALARAVAGRLRIDLRRTIASRAEVETAVSGAVSELRASRVFGASDLTDTNALQALTAYEVLFTDSAERFRFEHEIVAAYLVAEKLGREWMTHAALLDARTLDEGWILASEFVPLAEREAFFRKLCDTDLVLAARAAAEYEFGQSTVETSLLARYGARPISAVERWDLYTALATLGTRTCLALLARTAKATKPKTDDNDHANRALCLAGDQDTLRTVLDEADRAQSSPGLRVSGGAVSWWESAPVDVALNIARERVGGQSNAPIVASLTAIGRYGDATDVALLRSVIDTNEDPWYVLHAYFAADAIGDPGVRSAALTRAQTFEPPDRVFVLNQLDAEVDDPSWLLDIALGRGRLGEQTARSSGAHQSALELLAKVELSAAQQDEVLAAYHATSDYNAHEAIWQVAAKTKIAAFEAVAVEVIRSRSAEVGPAANFAMDHKWVDAGLYEEFSRLAVAAVGEEAIRGTWSGWRLCAFLLTRGLRQPVASALEASFSELVAAARELQEGRHPSLMRDGVDRFANVPEDHLAVDISMMIATPLKEAAAVADLIPESVRVSLLGVDLHGCKAEGLETLLTGIAADKLDAELTQIKDGRLRTYVACFLSKLGATSTRIDAIAEGFRLFLDHPPMMSKLVKAARRCWSDAMLERLVLALAGREASGRFPRMQLNHLAELAGNVTRAQAKNIIAPRLAGGSLPPLARAALQFWMEVAMKRPSDEEP